MNILICDDEQSILERMVNMTTEFQEFPLTVYSTTTSDEAVQVIQSKPLEAVILDIDIDERSGIELARYYKKYNPTGLIVFITSYTSYAIDAFQVEASKYLIKPVQVEAFYEILCFLKNKVDEQTFIENHMFKTVPIKVNGKQILLKQSDIIYIEKVGKKAAFHTLHGRYEVRETMKEIDELLTSDLFLKCHQGYIINIDHIYKLERYIVYIGDQKKPIPVSKANVELVQNAIKRRIWGE
ncbi:LytR/AlgR family response regulator transcription factor [Fusibacter ferrireducens]|uniref:Stage 0 sporulation protein A homolog n=1 Tax=Fusibacter ferrireducens TaxID=2785058 RepID=A0ABR9ZWZ1_9FIRM|nr:LytTR family DNA-binding domain-containing protein [Fusibacter ferrireducens]MBF4694989.1 response regulator transcription factor [Fusibacter ferrireducens]